MHGHMQTHNKLLTLLFSANNLHWNLELKRSSNMSSSGHRVALFHVASVMVESLLYQSQVGVIYSVTPCLVGCVRKDCVLGSAGKTKPAALSPVSLSVSINQPLFSPPALLPPYSLCFFSSSLSLFQWVIKQIKKKITSKIFFLCVFPVTLIHTKRTHAQKPGHEKVAVRGRDGGTICPAVVYQSARPQRSARPP